MDRYSFLVRIFHSLLHAGLSRRTNILISLTTEGRGGAERNRLLTSTIAPIPTTRAEEITELRNWAQQRAVWASAPESKGESAKA